MASLEVFVSADATITTQSQWIGVKEILVSDSSGVCGNDIALLILSSSVDIGKYVEAVIDPPMTDSDTYTTMFAAIGYGVDSPNDVFGVSAGTRRIKEDISITCVADDPRFADCEDDVAQARIDFENEFLGGNGTCNGDSGSGAFEQSHFDVGSWVAFGVLSRVHMSPDGSACEESIYTRFDAFPQLLGEAAARAAAYRGGMAETYTDYNPGCSVVPSGHKTSILTLILVGLAPWGLW